MRLEDDIQSVLSEARSKEQRAYRRASLYLAIPVSIGFILVAISTGVVLNLQKTRDTLSKDILAAHTDLDKTKKANSDLQGDNEQAKKTLLTTAGELTKKTVELADLQRKAVDKDRLIAQLDLKETSLRRTLGETQTSLQKTNQTKGAVEKNLNLLESRLGNCEKTSKLCRWTRASGICRNDVHGR